MPSPDDANVPQDADGAGGSLYFIEAYIRQSGDHQLMLDVDEAILTTPDAALRRSKVEQLLQGAIENARKT